MKVLYITANFDTHTGWGRYSSAVIEEARRVGIEASVLTNLELPKAKTLYQFITNCLCARKEAKNVDIVHALDTWPFGIYAYFAVFGTKKKLFVNAVGTYSVAPLDDFLKRSLIKFVYRRSQKVLAISNYVANLVCEKIQTDKLQTVYLGLTPLPEPSTSDLAWAREKIGNGKPVLLTVGTVEARKGQSDVAEAVQILTKEYTDIVYIMASVNADRAYLESIAKNKNVKYISDADTDGKIAALYTLSDIFVLASKRLGGHLEGFGLVALEAASFGKPVVAGSDSGVVEAINPNHTGYVATSGDPNHIAHCIEKITQKSPQTFATTSLEWAKNFTWQKTFAEYHKYYANV